MASNAKDINDINDKIRQFNSVIWNKTVQEKNIKHDRRGNVRIQVTAYF